MMSISIVVTSLTPRVVVGISLSAKVTHAMVSHMMRLVLVQGLLMIPIVSTTSVVLLMIVQIGFGMGHAGILSSSRISLIVTTSPWMSKARMSITL